MPVCFIAGTEILTDNGHVFIEQIKVGDMVWAEDPETGEKALKHVVQTFVNETNELVLVYVNGEEIITTSEHPFYSPVKGWVGEIHLRAGDIIVLVNGDYAVVEKIQHEILESPIKVYNFEVEDFQAYFVDDNSVLVHNVCSGKINGYTKHGLNQAIGRDGGKGVSPKAILETIKNPLKVISQEGAYGTAYKYVGKNANVVLNIFGEVVTTYAKNSSALRGGK